MKQPYVKLIEEISSPVKKQDNIDSIGDYYIIDCSSIIIINKKKWHEAIDHLTVDEKENACFFIGKAIGNTFWVEDIYNPEDNLKRSFSHIVFSHKLYQDLENYIESLEKKGFEILTYMHTHPFSSMSSLFLSETDINDMIRIAFPKSKFFIVSDPLIKKFGVFIRDENGYLSNKPSHIFDFPGEEDNKEKNLNLKESNEPVKDSDSNNLFRRLVKLEKLSYLSLTLLVFLGIYTFFFLNSSELRKKESSVSYSSQIKLPINKSNSWYDFVNNKTFEKLRKGGK